MVNFCGNCEYCNKGEEQYCDKRVLTYASIDPFHNNELTQGGYSSNIVVSEKFAIKIPRKAQIEKVAPLLCAGITTYSPIQFTHIKKGDKVAVAGFGGLGHMALQYAVALGAQATVFDITEDKRQEALNMGAVKYVNVHKPEELKGLDDSFRVILSTIPSKYEPAMYLRMLRMDGGNRLVSDCLPENTSECRHFNLHIFRVGGGSTDRRSVASAKRRKCSIIPWRTTSIRASKSFPFRDWMKPIRMFWQAK